MLQIYTENGKRNTASAPAGLTRRAAITALALCAVFMLISASCAGTSKRGKREPTVAAVVSDHGGGLDSFARGASEGGADNAVPADGAQTAGTREKQSVAVYMADAEREEIKGAYKILGGELARAISVSDKYIAVNRTDIILEILGAEHVYQRSGAVSDEQIQDLGRQVGVQYLCIAEISEVKGGTYYLDVRLVDVVTAKTVSSATAGSNLADINEMIRAARELAQALMGGKIDAREIKPAVIESAVYADAAKPVSRADGADFRDGKIGADMVFVKGGSFVMGCTPEQESCWDSEKPAHRVTLGSYYIGKYPVTQKQWQSVMGTNPSDTKGDALPVHNVSWDEVQEFIAKIKKATGRKYRLPTEAEWEYAARGGVNSKGYKFAGSNDVSEVAWYEKNCSDVQRAGAKKPNELGLHDMSGNVCEWVNDYFGDYGSASQTDPPGPQSGSMRALRGGPHFKGTTYMRIAIRNGAMPDGEQNGANGFRLAMSPDGER